MFDDHLAPGIGCIGTFADTVSDFAGKRSVIQHCEISIKQRLLFAINSRTQLLTKGFDILAHRSEAALEKDNFRLNILTNLIRHRAQISRGREHHRLTYSDAGCTRDTEEFSLRRLGAGRNYAPGSFSVGNNTGQLR